MAQDALERLFNSNNHDESVYSVEEQLDATDNTDDDFLDGMSSEASDALYKSVTEVTLDEPIDENKTDIDYENYSTNEPEPESMVNNESTNTDDTDSDDIVVSDPNLLDEAKNDSKNEEELFNNNINTVEVEKEEEVKKPRRKRRTKESEPTASSSIPNDAFNPIMDQLAKDVIDDLRKSKYKINRFDNNTMEIVFNYMYNKF